MSHGKQFTLYTHAAGPNGWKVAYLLVELGLTYEPVFFDFAKKDQKSPEYLKLNPNGRIPAIIDHGNNDFVLWESNAILLYIVEKYDKEHKFSAVTDADKAYQNQWLSFQASGQGPYFGQFTWFHFYHPEKVSSAEERYKGETERVFGVLDAVLSKQEWLVAGKMTISDMSFISWNLVAFQVILGDDYPFAEKFPAVYKWHNAMAERPAIKACIEQRASMMSH